MGSLDDIAGTTVYLDANVFIYHLEGFAQFTAVLNRFFEKVDDGEAQAVTSELTLGETLVKPMQKKDTAACATYEHFLRSSKALTVVPISREILVRAAELRASSSTKLPDAIHFATAVVSGCNSYITNDKGAKPPPSVRLVLLSDLTL